MFFGNDGSAGGSGEPKHEFIAFIIMAAIAGFVIGIITDNGIVKILTIAGALLVGRIFGALSTAYCIRVSILAAISIAVFWGVKTAPLIGAIVIASLWHFWSVVTTNPNAPNINKSAVRRQKIFFDAIFSLLGYIAKADGVVCKREINFAAALMTKMKLSEERRAHARELFERGKIADFDIDKVLEQVRKECQGNIGMFMRILSHAALINGEITEVERRILKYAGFRLGLSESEIEQIEAAVRSGEGYRQSGSQSYGEGRDDGGGHRVKARPGGLIEAYKILGVLSNASNSDVKRSYRRLMSRHHPDKLASTGIPPEMMRVATERAQEISGAYERIKKARGI